MSPLQPLGDLVSHRNVPVPPHAPIHGKYTSLVPIANSHCESLHRHLGGEANAHLWTYLPINQPSELEDSTKLFSKWANSKDPQFYVVLSSPESDPASKALGIMSLLAIVPEHRRAELGIILGNALQKTTIATEALYLLIHRCFELGYDRLEWKTNNLNKPSLSAAERLGFTTEGVLRKHMVMKGKRRDTACFSITDDDWPVVGRGLEAWLDASNFDDQGKQKRSLKECTET